MKKIFIVIMAIVFATVLIVSFANEIYVSRILSRNDAAKFNSPILTLNSFDQLLQKAKARIFEAKLDIIPIGQSDTFGGNENFDEYGRSESLKGSNIASGYAKGELIVKFKPGVLTMPQNRERVAVRDLSVGSDSVLALNAKIGLIEVERFFKGAKKDVSVIKKTFSKRSARIEQGTVSPSGMYDIYKLIVPDNADIKQLADEYKKNSSVEWAEPNYIFNITSVIPSDPFYASFGSWDKSYAGGYWDMWGLHKIESAQAWEKEKGNSSVVVAVVDTGVDYEHEDLKNNMWINSKEIPDNGIDDDLNGFIDDIYGWNFPNDYGEIMDDHGHGTHVAGIISAVTDNSTGISGVSWNAKIMGLKGLSKNGTGDESWLANSIMYAADNGADIINMSWGSQADSMLLENAVDYAYSLGVVLVAAAGNSNMDALGYFPAGYEKVITVAASDYFDKKASFSNYGSVVDVSAPGVDILSLRANNTDMYNDNGSHIVNSLYYRASGTSMASPYVAGLASLVISKNPAYSNQEIADRIRVTADNIDAINTDYAGKLGTGRINSYKALSDAATPSITITSIDIIDDKTGNYNDFMDPGEIIDMNVTFKNTWADASNVSIALNTPGQCISAIISNANLGNILSGNEAVASYQFKINESCPRGELVNYLFDIASDSANYSNKEVFSMRIPQYNLVVANYTIDDSTGDNKGTLNPGENAGMSITLRNDSLLPLKNVKATLKTSNANITMQNQEEVNFGDISAGNSTLSAVPFSFSVSQKAVLGEQIIFELNATSDSDNWKITIPIKTEVSLYHYGWPFKNAVVGETPIVADLNGDGKKEIIAGTMEGWVNDVSGKIYVFDYNGNYFPGWENGKLKSGWFYTPPSAGDINGDGKLEVVAVSDTGTTYAWDYLGNEILSLQSSASRSYSALSDIDGDGKSDIITKGSDGKIHIYNNNGQEINGWIGGRADSVSSIIPPAIGDLNNDKKPDLVVSAGNKFVAFDYTGTKIWEIQLTDEFRAGYVVLGDINKDGNLEVVGRTEKGGAWNISVSINVWDNKGIAMPGFPVKFDKPNDFMAGTVALGDIDGNGDLEIVSGGLYSGGITSLYAWHHNGSLVKGFPAPLPSEGTHREITIADIDGNKGAEIILETRPWISQKAHLIIFKNNGTVLDNWMIELPWRGIGTAISDIDNDGNMEIVGGARYDWTGDIRVWDLPYKTSYKFESARMDWPQYQRDSQHTGMYPKQPVPQAITGGCPDINADGKISSLDLIIAGQSMDACEGNLNYNPKADLTGDFCVNQADLDRIKNNFSQLSNCATLRKCPDINHDQTITVLDTIPIGQSWFLCEGSTGYNQNANVTGDRCVDNGDMIAATNYLERPVSEVPLCGNTRNNSTSISNTEKSAENNNGDNSRGEVNPVNRENIDGNVINTNNEMIRRDAKIISSSTKTVRDISLYQRTSQNSGILKTGSTSVEYSGKLEVKESRLYMNTSAGQRQINILPEDAVKASGLTDINRAKVELNERSARPIYSVNDMQRKKILSLVAVSMETKTEIDAETGKVVSINKPWWSFLAW